MRNLCIKALLLICGVIGAVVALWLAPLGLVTKVLIFCIGATVLVGAVLFAACVLAVRALEWLEQLGKPPF